MPVFILFANGIMIQISRKEHTFMRLKILQEC